MSYRGDIFLGDTIDVKFCTVQATGAPTTLSSSPVISAYIGNSTTQITAGITLSVDFDGVTGLNNVRVVASGGNGYAAATNVDLVITTGTVNSVSAVGYVVGSFSIQARGVNQILGTAVSTPATAGILDVNVKNIDNDAASASGTVTFPNATLASTTNITAGTLTTVTTATNVTTVNGLAANVITAAAIADAAIDTATFAADVGFKSIRSNTAQAGAATTITLDASASASNSFYNNDLIVLTGGTGVGQARFITAYVGATKVATVATWVTNPDNTTTFAVLPYDAVAGATAPTVAQIATAVWQDSTAGDFTAASSIGKSLYTSGVVPGGTNGLFIAGTNAATTITTSLTTTFTGNLTGKAGLDFSNITMYAAGPFAPTAVVDSGTAQSATGTTLVLRSAAAFADSELVGATVVIRSATAGAGQRRLITANVGSTDTITVDTWTTTPTGTIVYDIFGSAPGSSTSPAPADVLKWNGTAVSTPATAGIPDVNVKNIDNDAASASGTVTFPNATLASTTNITAGTITTVTTTTTATNVTTVNGLAAGVITATSIASAALSSAKFAADSGQVPIRSNTAQAGAATTITLDASASATNSFYNNTLILLTGGTGVGQSRFITAYVGATKVATVATWGTNPDNTTTFAILPFDAVAGATAPTAAQVATAVWQDATGSDFTAASSIGKSLYTTGAVPGAAGGLFIAGTNAATTITTALTTTFTGNLTGSVGSVTGAVGSVTGAVGSVTGNVGGNVVGSVASVTGAVGSVTGNVGGNVVGTVASVVGAVGSVTGNVGGNVVGTVASVTAITTSGGYVYADTKKINAVVVTGSGTTLDPWGP